MDMNQDFNFHNSNSSLLSFFKSYKSLSKMPEGMGQEIPTEVQNQEVQTIENREIRNIHQNQNNNMQENIHNSIPKHLIQEVQLQQENNNFNEPKSDQVSPQIDHVQRNNHNHNNQVIPQHNNQIQHTSFINGNLNNNINNNSPNIMNNNNGNVINSMSTVNNHIIPTTIQNNNPNLVPNPNNQIVSDTCNLLTIPPSPSQNIKYVDITEFLSLPQTEAAKKLGLPVSTLSKRWKEAVKERKWPYRKVSKLDKEITTLLYNIPQSGPEAGKLGYETEQKLGRLLRLRQEELKPVVIRI
eukprot:TRINITY_DN11928_c0_g1_i1.p1 TRINITY_DN11928_c0_g1~~TRINITY_DN11928_c0_g1_i1.p1  ORF type:complete len:298 (+),score=97.22 TRINITY_DN11928_c0_g1_i1:161-1054(+)